MKKSLVLAMAMALGVTASAYAANPFSDVPAGHWAYDSVNKLAAAGIVDGYGNGTFGGDRLMTRYEMAQIVAKAMAKGANVDRLAAEFADELDSLGVRVAALEKKSDNVKITGQIRAHYADYSGDADGYASKIRSRIFINGQINENWTYTGMLQNEQNLANDSGDEKTDFQRAFVTGKVGAVTVTGGRYQLFWADGDTYDNRFDGIQLAAGKDVKFVAGYGKAANASAATAGVNDGSAAGTTYYGKVSGKIGALEAEAGYLKFEDVTKFDEEDDSIWHVGAKYNFNKDVSLGAVYMRSDVDGTVTYTNGAQDSVDKDGYVVTLNIGGAKASKPGSAGFVAKYYDQGAGTYTKHTMNGLYPEYGFKGYSLAGYYTVAKNMVAGVEYFDLKDKIDDSKAKTLWTQMIFTF